MIVFLDGELAEKRPGQAVVCAGGVGYAAEIPLSTYDRLPAVGARVHLLTVHVVREDAEQLFGFATEEERRLFSLLTGVSGIGPRLGLAVLSGMKPSDFIAAVSAGDARRLAGISGIGKKLAERLVVEMKNRIPKEVLMEASFDALDADPDGLLARGDTRLHDAVDALAALGYKPTDAAAAAKEALRKLPAEADVAAVLRAVLSTRNRRP